MNVRNWQAVRFSALNKRVETKPLYRVEIPLDKITFSETTEDSPSYQACTA